jgi:hypothetical protein
MRTLLLLLGCLPSTAVHPVFIIPGWPGNKLVIRNQTVPPECAAEEQTISINHARLFDPEKLRCYAAVLAKPFDPTCMCHPDDGSWVDWSSDPSGLGLIYESTADNILLEPLIDHLKSRGMVAGVNLFGAPYDWRHGYLEVHQRG